MTKEPIPFMKLRSSTADITDIFKEAGKRVEINLPGFREEYSIKEGDTVGCDYALSVEEFQIRWCAAFLANNYAEEICEKSKNKGK